MTSSDSMGSTSPTGKPERVAVERQRRLDVAHDVGHVMDAAERATCRPAAMLPPAVAACAVRWRGGPPLTFDPRTRR